MLLYESQLQHTGLSLSNHSRLTCRTRLPLTFSDLPQPYPDTKACAHSWIVHPDRLAAAASERNNAASLQWARRQPKASTREVSCSKTQRTRDQRMPQQLPCDGIISAVCRVRTEGGRNTAITCAHLHQESIACPLADAEFLREQMSGREIRQNHMCGSLGNCSQMEYLNGTISFMIHDRGSGWLLSADPLGFNQWKDNSLSNYCIACLIADRGTKFTAGHRQSIGYKCVAPGCLMACKGCIEFGEGQSSHG